VCTRCGRAFRPSTHSRSIGVLLAALSAERVAQILRADFGWSKRGWPSPCDDCAAEIAAREVV
jgi:hypothetical protein